MPLGAFKLNGISKFTVTAVAEVIRAKKGIAAYGGAQVDTAQSKFGGSSLLLDGTGDYLQIKDNTLVYWNTQPYTVEFWTRVSAFNSNANDDPTIVGNTNPSGEQDYWSFGPDNSGNLTFKYYNGSSITIKDSGTMSLNTWYHCAAVIASNTITIYLDGVSKGSASISGTPQFNTNYGFNIGWGNSTTAYNGYVDELRISDTARYTSNFTPSTTPFVNDENTLLLLHMNGTDSSNYFEDDNGVRAKKGVIAYGNAQVNTTQSKFGGTSLKLDGTGDYLLTAPGSYDLSGDFTLECWFFQNGTSTALKIFDGRGAASAQGGNGTLTLADVLMVDNASATPYRIRFFVDGAERNSTSQSITNLAWHHMAMVRSGTTFTFYVDGVSYGTYTQSPVKDYSSMMSDYFQVIGSSSGTGGYWNGYIDEFRISSSARYTANFTPSTTPFVNDTNTLLLLHMDGTDVSTVFRDDNGMGRAPANFDTVFGGTISTSQSKFGGSSWYQSAEYYGLQMNDETPLDAVGTGEFTLEMWVYRQNNPTVNTATLWDGYSNKFSLYYDETNNQLKYATQGIVRITGGSITLSTWTHIAVVRNSSGSTKLYINGTQSGSTTNLDDRDWATCLQHLLGVSSNGNNSWVGYIDEVRISNVQRYTGNFTAPTTPFQNDDNTLLLLHMDGTDASTVFVDDNGVTPNWEY